MKSTTSDDRAGVNRRAFLCTTAAVAATAALNSASAAVHSDRSAIKAVVFDAFAIFDARSVFLLVEEMFPEHGTTLSDQWGTRQFEYTWLRNSMRQHTDFWHVTQDALNYAAKLSGVNLSDDQSKRLMAAYLEQRPWPDVSDVLDTPHKRGLRLALLTNWTSAMQHACLQSAGLEALFDFQLSTDGVKAYKPDPAAYRMGPEAFRIRKQEIAFVAFGGWDAAGAKAFGYPTYWVNRFDLPPEELGMSIDATSPDLSALPNFIDSGYKG